MHHCNLHFSHNMIEYSMKRIARVPAKISRDEIRAEGAFKFLTFSLGLNAFFS
jgi:hypothetical protein